jgi:hypothetical protein
MVRVTVLIIAVLLAGAGQPAAAPVMLPPLALEDQQGRRLDLGDLRGRVVVIVYGTRARVEDHIAWGRRLETGMIERGVYHAEDPPEQRPVRILALGQMGGIPSTFRPIIRTVVREHTPADFSLWLDWEDRMSVFFGAERARSSVVVADRTGHVRLVTTGASSDVAVARVVEVVLRLL